MLRIRNRHFLSLDLLLLSAASYLSFVLRLDTFDLGEYWSGFVVFTLLMLVATPAIFLVSGLYSRYWRCASVEDLLLLCSCVGLAVIANSLATLVLFEIAQGTIGIPRSIPPIYYLFALAAIAGPRFAVRLASRPVRAAGTNALPPTLVVTAGDAGSMVVRDLQQEPRPSVHFVGLIDDDRQKRHTRIYGVPVLGTRYDILSVVQQHEIKQIIIAMPGAAGKTIREIVQICERAGIKPKIIPASHELLDGNITVSQIRDLQIEDLLRREPVQIDINTVSALLRGRRVMVTGGGGSIGGELCRQIMKCQPAELVVLGHGENSVFEICNELDHTLRLARAAGEDAPTVVHPVIADIRFRERLQAVFAQHCPEIVFHAAAHKHVPLMEQNPIEAVSTNILGTRNVIEAARESGTERLLMISSDKAVSPTSVMGATKRVAEFLVYRAARASGRGFMSVRFGNVLGSRGSVLLTFRKQISSGGPITITHPDIQRYFMTIPEAVTLVLQAVTMGSGGEVFVLDMGEPVKIVDLASDMVRLSGLELERDIDIVFTGLRPGEKLYEEMFTSHEIHGPTEHAKIMVARNAAEFVPVGLEQWITALEIATQRNDTTAAIWALQHMLRDQVMDVRAELEPAIDVHMEPLLELSVG